MTYIERAALAVLGAEPGWRLAGHEYGAVVRGPVVAECSDLAIDAVRALEHRGWEMPWEHWHDEHGELQAWHGHLTLLSPGVAAARRRVLDLADQALRSWLLDAIRTLRDDLSRAGRADRIAYRRRQLARRRRSRR